MASLWVSHRLQIPEPELEFSYVRSSGPGGQNVNKVNSKAVLRWSLRGSASVPPDLLERLLSKLGPKLTREGDLLIASDRFRDQGRNREDCLEKLRELLVEALHQPKARKASKPTRGSQRRKREAKSRHSEKKRERRRFDD
jgi:ribosome-associated protein